MQFSVACTGVMLKFKMQMRNNSPSQFKVHVLLINEYYSITSVYDTQKLRTILGVSLFQTVYGTPVRPDVRTIHTFITL